MARGNDRGPRRVVKERPHRGKPKVCIFCKDRVDWVDYKDINQLRRFMSDRGKIRARRVSGNCAQHQRDVAVAIKTARELALLPYTQRTMSERGPGRGGRGGDRGGSGGGGRGGPRYDSEQSSDRGAPPAPPAAEAASVAEPVDADVDVVVAEVGTEAEDTV
jgi:small subunit ribosomal protein S18